MCVWRKKNNVKNAFLNTYFIKITFYLSDSLSRSCIVHVYKYNKELNDHSIDMCALSLGGRERKEKKTVLSIK